MKRSVILHIVSIFFLFYYGSESSNPPNPQPTQLSLLVDELSIIARITNAIALQSGAINQNLLVHDVIADLIGGNTTLLDEILAVDVPEAVKFIKWINNETTTVNNGGFALTPAITDDIVQISYGVNVYQQDQTTWKEIIKNMDPGKLAREFAALKSGVPCFPSDSLKTFAYFLKAFEENTRLTTLGKKKIALEATNPAVVGKLKMCVQNVIQWNTEYSTSDAKPVYDLLKIQMKVASLGEYFAFFATQLKDFENHLKQLKDDFKKIESIWSRLPLTGQEATVSINMYKATDSLKSYSENRQLNIRDSHLTSAFRSYKDILKVGEDLNSSWFKTIVSKGKSVENLTTALGPFLLFSDKVKKFGETWEDLTTILDTNEDIPNKALKEILSFEKTPKLYDRMDNVSTISKQCIELLNLNELGSAVSQFEEINELLRDPYHAMGYMNEVLEFPIFFQNFNVTDMEDTLKRINTRIKPLPSHEVHRAVKEEGGHLDRFNILTSLYEAQEKVLQMVGGSIAKQQINLQPFLDNSHLEEMLDCMVNMTFDEILISKLVNYLKTVQSYPNDQKFQSMYMFLNKLKETKEATESIEALVRGMDKNSTHQNILLDLEDSMHLAEKIGRGLYALGQIEKVLQLKETLGEMKLFGFRTTSMLKTAPPELVSAWLVSHQKIPEIMKELGDLEETSKKLRENQPSLTELKTIFEKAAKISGMQIDKKQMSDLVRLVHEKGDPADYPKFKKLSEVHLNFASFTADLTAAAGSLDQLRRQFDIMFGFVEKSGLVEVEVIKNVTSVHLVMTPYDGLPNYVVALICTGVFTLLLLAVFIAWSFTKNGRKKIKMWYIYYTGNKAGYEKRWRYSMFTDTFEEQNILVDSAREVNPINVLKALKRGAYVNAYSRYGNTVLHSCSRRGYHEIVKLMIEHGADRELLNHENKKPEEMIPKDWESHKDPVIREKFRKTLEVHKKYKNKHFRKDVPEEFPWSSYHIWAEKETNDEVAFKFFNEFEMITSCEELPSTTHCVVAVDKDGALDSEEFDTLQWVFRGVIIVNEQWMVDCLEDKKMIEKDYNYLVRDVKFDGKLYKDSITRWSNAMSKFTFPYLFGVHIIIVAKECEYYAKLQKIVFKLGGTLWQDMPPQDLIKKGSHPYLHAHLNPFWIVHDGNFDVARYKNNPEDLYEVFMLEDFFDLMFERKINRNTSPNPIPVVEVKNDY